MKQNIRFSISRTKTFLTPIILILAALTIGVACTTTPGPEGTSVVPPTAGPGMINTDTLIAQLRAADLAVEPGETFPPHIFSVPVHGILVNGAFVSVYEYADSETAAAEAAWVSPDGGEITYPDPENPGQTISIIREASGTPHYFRQENLLVSYGGDSLPILTGLQQVLGMQFAGGPFPEAGTIPTHYRYNWTLPQPRLRVEGDFLLPPAWLASEGQNEATPGSGSGYELSFHRGQIGGEQIIELIHADGVPPSMLGQDLAVVNLAAEEPVTLLFFIPYGSVLSVSAATAAWIDEPAFPAAEREWTGEGQHWEDFYTYTLGPLGEVQDVLLMVTLRFDLPEAGGGITYLWRINPGQNSSTFQPTTTMQTTGNLFATEEMAYKAVQTFLAQLHLGNYEEAVFHYGGDYAWLREVNPEVPADAESELLAQGCEVNGIVCLNISSIELVSAANGIFTFKVQFVNEDGSLFILEGCCGDDSGQTQDTFEFHVVQRGDQYLVQELPPYRP